MYSLDLKSTVSYEKPEVEIIKYDSWSVLMQSGSTTEPIDDGGDIN